MATFRPRLIASLLAALIAPTVALAQQVTRPPSPSTDGPTSSRLFIGPTARLLEPGEAYVVGYAVLIPNFEVGVTNRFQLGGGTLPPVFWVTPKVQLFRNESRAIAVGTLQVFVPAEFAGGLAYLNTTREIGTGAFTLGAGWAYSTDDGTFRFASGVPVVQLGAERQVNARWAFVTENYIAWGVGWISGGGRYQRQHFGADFAILGLVGDGGGLAVPTINLSWKF